MCGRTYRAQWERARHGSTQAAVVPRAAPRQPRRVRLDSEAPGRVDHLHVQGGRRLTSSRARAAERVHFIISSSAAALQKRRTGGSEEHVAAVRCPAADDAVARLRTCDDMVSAGLRNRS